MKKLLTSILFIFAVALTVLVTMPGQAYAFDPLEDDYEDLFYDTHYEDEPNYSDFTFNATLATAGPASTTASDASGVSMFHAIWTDNDFDDETITNIKVTQYSLEYNATVQSINIVDEWTTEVIFAGEITGYFTVGSGGYMGITNGVFINTEVMSGTWLFTVTYISSYTPVEVQTLKPWTNHYTFGRSRDYDLDAYDREDYRFYEVPADGQARIASANNRSAARLTILREDGFLSVVHANQVELSKLVTYLKAPNFPSIKTLNGVDFTMITDIEDDYIVIHPLFYTWQVRIMNDGTISLPNTYFPEEGTWELEIEYFTMLDNPLFPTRLSSHMFELGHMQDAAFQSVYSSFLVKSAFSSTPLIDVDNVAVVFIDANPDGKDAWAEFHIYYWEDGDIEKTEYLWLWEDIALGYLEAYFYGGVRQAISGNAAIVGDVEDENDLEYYLSFLTAWDDIDGDISDQIYVIDDGDYNGLVVGTYTVEVGVTDSEDQESTFVFYAVVADLDNPTLVAPNLNQTISYTATFNFSTYLASLVKSDNYYDEEDITIALQENNYTANKSIPGIYTVTLRVADPSLNYTDYTLNLTVIDNVAPVFTAGVQTLSKDIYQMITTAQILATQSVVDAIDGNVTASITVLSNTYAGNETMPGEYEILIEAEDASGNTVQRLIQIGVFSGVPGWWLPNEGPIIIPNGSTLTFDQFKQVLVTTGWIAPDVEITLLSSDYFGNEETPGNYTLNLSVAGVPTQFNILVLNQGDDWFPNVPPLVAQPNFDWVWWTVGVLALAAVIGGAVFYFKNRKTA